MNQQQTTADIAYNSTIKQKSYIEILSEALETKDIDQKR